MRGISSLASMIRDYAESRNGRIHWFPHVYLFLVRAGRKPRKKRWDGKPWEERTDDATGLPYSIFAGRGAQCFHPTKWAGLFPYWSKDGHRAYFIVPQSDCRCCEFHEKSKPYGRARYAKCRWYRENSGLESPLQILEKSVEQAKEMLA